MLRYRHTILLLQLVSVIAIPHRAAAFPIAISTIEDQSLDKKCLQPMIVAKKNDNFIYPEEVPVFIQSLAIKNNLVDPTFNVTTIADFPYSLIVEINNFLCYNVPKDTICDPKINVTGAVNFNNVDKDQKNFLKSVCNELLGKMRSVLGPSHPPSSSPSIRPSIHHSNRPSIKPSTSPSSKPSSPPSSLPSVFTSSSPTVLPSDSPVVTPTPSLPPSDKPSEAPAETLSVTFGLVNMFGLSASDIAQNVGGSLLLIDSVFSDFTQEIESALFTQTIGGNGRNLRNSNVRILEVDFKDDQYVTNIEDKACPKEILDKFKNRSPAPKCEHMSGIITYIVSGRTNPDITENIIERRAEEGIQDNRLNDKVPEELRDDYYFYSLNGNTITLILPVAAIAGITIGAALIGLIAGRLLFRRRIQNKNNEQYDGLNGPADTMEDDEFNSNKDSFSPSYKGLVVDSFYSRDNNELSLENSVASSSNAGSSGWSSSAGISSLNTGSVDSSEYFGSSLAAIGAASNLSKRYKASGKDDMYPIVADIEESSMSESDNGLSELETDDESNFGQKNRQFAIREELENAIQNGDWSLVGATAAIIAQSPAEFLNNGDINSTFSSGLSSSIGTSPRNNERAVELDRLVEAGDWEGVVLAAAKFEAENDDKDIVTEGSASMSEGQQFLAARSHAQQSDSNSTNSPSVSTNISESFSNNVKRAEIRAEVEALVRRVVPDEMDNVSEMMNQFKGREEELVETLRTMQERSIAARQREAMRRNAKREARKMAKQNKPPSGRPINLNRKPTPQDMLSSNELNSSFFSAYSSGENDCGGSKFSTSSKENSKNSILTPSRAALDHAIKIGDWEAVGKTAEQLGDRSVSSASEYLSADDHSIMSDRSYPNHPDTDRAAELEGLIDQGDWSAVVAAASRFATADLEQMQSKGKKREPSIHQSKTDAASSQRLFDDAVSQSTETKNKEIRKEEEDALAQAEIWMTIAAQSKKGDSSATKGASDAADWAISRSLKQIIQSNDNHETQSAASSCDDKSV